MAWDGEASGGPVVVVRWCGVSTYAGLGAFVRSCAMTCARLLAAKCFAAANAPQRSLPKMIGIHPSFGGGYMVDTGVAECYHLTQANKDAHQRQ